jgi:flagellar biosynthesis/type III secretory pathway protein FliH
MTQTQREELLRYFPPTDDPEVLQNREALLRGLVKVFPKLRDEMIAEARNDGLDEGKRLGLDEGKQLGLDEGKKLGLDEGARVGKVEEARKAVERVLRRRGLAVTEAQAAQIATCNDLDTLERWHDLAITAASADEALR